MDEKIVEIINGGKHTDSLRTLSYFNDFDLTSIKRFYIIEHPNINIIRVWQSHGMSTNGFMLFQDHLK